MLAALGIIMEESEEEWLADYLRLEYGEDKNDPKSIKSSDLKYIGEFIINGVITEYWSYPTSGEPMWATIEIIDDKDYASMTSVPPPRSINE